MALKSGYSQNGWIKHVLPNGVVEYKHDTLTHTSSTSSALFTGFLPDEVINHLFNERFLFIEGLWGSGTKTTTLSLEVFANDLSTLATTFNISNSAARASTASNGALNPYALNSSASNFNEKTTVFSPYMKVKDLAASGSGTNTLNISIYLMTSLEGDVAILQSSKLMDIGDMNKSGINY